MATNNGTKTDNDAKDEAQDTDISFVVALFDDTKMASEAYKSLKDANREGMLKILAAAYMEKSERSKIKVHEFKDWSGKRGAVAGGTAGAVIGLIGTAVLLPVAAGALIGGTMAKLHDTKFNNEDLKNAAKSLPVGTSALVAIVEDDYVDAMEDELNDSGGQKIHSGEVPNSTIISMTEIFEVS